ncbi:hypothetical protein J4208_00240 [Candidatus Woesearchaeota archaeon]|nr:hypothetical protein [Candidatus Woesearchaeota archaeon]
MKKLLLAFVFLTAFFVIGCAVPQEPVVQQTSTDAPTVEGLQQDLTGLDTLEEDIDVSDLEGVEDDLNVDF